MKRLCMLTFSLALLFALASITYSADEVLTPERLCGIWEGTFTYQDRYLARAGYNSKLLITQNLNGVFCHNVYGLSSTRILDGQGEIINNQLIMRQLIMSDRVVERIKVNMNSKNMLEGEGYTHNGIKG